MRVLRVILIVVGVLVVIGALGFGAAFYFTRGATDAADAFFHSLATDGPEVAYSRTAPSFRASTSQTDFIAAVNQLGLRKYKSASWDSRSVENSKAELDGTLALEGGALPVKVQLAKDDTGTWRIITLNLPATGLQRTGSVSPSGVAKPTLPSADAAHLLAQVSFQQLAEAIKAKNFQAIYLSTTSEFQSEFSIDQLTKQFKPFADHDVDLTRTDPTQLVIDPPPHLDDNDQLVLKGHQSTPVQPWYFRFTYAQGARGWLLTGISLSTKPD